MTPALAAPILQVTVFGLSSGAVYALFALGLVLIYRTTGVLNFAHWSIGLLALVLYALMTGAGVPGWIGLLVALPASAAAGVAAYRLVFRRVARASQIIVILIAIGVAQFYSSLAAMALGFQQYTELSGWLPAGQLGIGSGVDTSELITFIAALGIAAGLGVWLRASRTGRALRAVAQNREAAALAGIDDVRYSSIAWAIGSVLAAFALLLIFPHAAAGSGGLISTGDLTAFGTLLVPAFGAALIGGLVHLPLAVAGGFVFGLAQELLILAPAPFSQLRSVAAALLILVLLLLRTERFFATSQELEALQR